MVSIYIAFELGASSSNYNDPTLKNCLSGAVTLTKNSDIDEYGYFGYRIRFDRRSSYSSPGGGFGQNIIMLGVDMSYFIHIDNKKRHFNSWKRTNSSIRTNFNCRKKFILLILQ